MIDGTKLSMYNVTVDIKTNLYTYITIKKMDKELLKDNTNCTHTLQYNTPVYLYL